MDRADFSGNDLPAPEERQEVHLRRLVFQGFLRHDGLWDIDGELIDTKPFDYVSFDGEHKRAGVPVHNMRIRLTIDDGMKVHAVAVAMPYAPFPECQGGANPLQALVGATLGRGWRNAVEAAAGDVRGCTHLREMLSGMATAAFQAVPGYLGYLSQSRGEPRLASQTPPAQFGQCISWDFNGSAVARVAPKFAGYRPPDRR